MSEKTSKKGIIFNLLVLLSAAVLLVVAFFNRGFLTQRKNYTFESSSEVAFGRGGNILVIDNGKRSLLLLDKNENIIRRYDGGTAKSAFYYACYAVQAEDGSIYVADITYGSRGNMLDSERIIRLDGSKAKTVFEIDYSKYKTKDTPLQYGRILELKESGGRIYFLLDTVDTIEVKCIEPDGSVTDAGSVAASGVKNDAAYDIETGTVAVINRTGEISLYDVSSGEVKSVTVPAGLMPYSISAGNGEVYYTELNEKTVRHFSVDSPDSSTVYSSFDVIPFKLFASGNGTDVLVTDQIGFYRLAGGQDGGASQEYVENAKVSYFLKEIMTWAVLIAGGLCLLYIIIVILKTVIKAALHSENALRIVLIVVAVAAMSFVVAYTLSGQVMSSGTDASEKQVSLFSKVLLAEIDKEALLELDEPSDYGTESFTRLKAPLDSHTMDSYDDGDYFYYILYRRISGNVVMVMDYEDTMPCTMPMYVDDPEDNDYSAVLHNGKTIALSEVSAYGSWSFQLTPIYDDNGNIIGELEVGQSLDSLRRQQREVGINLALNAVTGTVVIVMIMLELTFLIAFYQKKKKENELDNAEKVPVRSIMFLSYLADSMQDAFIAILCAQLYKGGLPVPDGVAVALPMSAQLLMMAVFSLVAGSLAEKFGSRRILTLGMAVQLSGFICCFIFGTYWGILAGKMLIGSGMGIVYVACNTVASTGDDPEKSANAFAGVAAGVISGLTIGAGLASVLISIGGWKLIYLMGAVILVMGVAITASSTDVRTGKKSAQAGEKSEITFREFFFNRRVLGFFALILVPFMMALSYREYFFPLFAEEHGITEVRIGQIYLVCGMMVIYIGPYLSSLLLKRFGVLRSVIGASAALGLGMLLFVVYPNTVSVIAGVVILSIVISFAYTCQYSYFERTPESSAFGEGRSMGIYSVFESIGQTIGPVAYGALLAFGYRKGIGIFSAAMLALVMIFALTMIKYRNIYKESRDE